MRYIIIPLAIILLIVWSYYSIKDYKEITNNRNKDFGDMHIITFLFLVFIWIDIITFIGVIGYCVVKFSVNNW